ncbi:MAG TPA: GGDEF domain-containing protein [Burkholderiaceae bacterium]|nr:GGDEF domain-containing protein [Burkholderiaceae bacterium]
MPPLLFAGATLVLLVVVVLLVAHTLQIDRHVHANYEQAVRLSHLAFDVQQGIGRLRALRWAERGQPPRRPQQIESDLQASLSALAVLDLTAVERAHFDALRREVMAALRARPATGGRLPDTGAQFEEIDRLLSALVSAVHARSEAAAASAHNVTDFIRYALAGTAALLLLLGVTLAVLLVRTLSAHRRRLGQLDQLAREDGLTHVLNRRALDESLPIELARAQRMGYPLTVAMLDLDYFKRYNDRRGHGAGDALLRQAAQSWRRQLRPTDLLARYGGEEFTLVLPACDAAQAVVLIERLRPAMPERQTFSAGVSEWNRTDAPDALLRAADGALLAAKRGGRNRTVVAELTRQVELPLTLVSP